MAGSDRRKPPGVPHGLTPLEAAAAVAAACRDQALTAGAYAVIARSRAQHRLAGVLDQARRTLSVTADALDGAAEAERLRERIRAARLGNPSREPVMTENTAAENPAGIMRRAAVLMRERAAEAEQEGYGSDHPGRPWCPERTWNAVRHVNRNVDTDHAAHPWGSEHEGDCNTWGRYAGHHIARMHPGVALALAAWLDAAAQAWDEGMKWDEALGVARAYLGEDDPS